MTPLELLQSENAFWKLSASDQYSPHVAKNTQRLTVDELSGVPLGDLFALGFGNWDQRILLFPIWAIDLLADGQFLIDIGGGGSVKGVDVIDLDTRHGMLAYGFRHPGLKDLNG